MCSSTSLAPTFRTTRGQPEHHNMNRQRPENLHSNSSDERITSGEQTRTWKISVAAYLKDLSSFIL
jgi:hypothetical protein